MMFFLAALFLTLDVSSYCLASSWDAAESGQYHIQSDEGHQRYFRYQTFNGQYRKEKRLGDGTVIGTYAWIDAAGYLRQRDYIADKGGYRILKTKKLYVGVETPIAKAMNEAKTLQTPSSAGTLVKAKDFPISSTTVSSPTISLRSNTVSEFLMPPPLHSTLAPVSVEFNRNSTVLLPLSKVILSTPPTSPLKSWNQVLPSWQQNNILGESSEKKPSYIDIQNHNNKGRLLRFQNGPTYPLDSNGLLYTGANNNHIFDGKSNGFYHRESSLNRYDGVAVTNDGFRYYIPKAYHEEKSSWGGHQKTGSFGYVDPFGIRRVVYYNAAPGTGFQHRKSNHYVGPYAPPYDPQPYIHS